MTDINSRAFIKRGKTFVPSDIFSEEMLDGLKEGQEYLVRITKPRSVQQHKYFFAMLHAVVRATDRWIDETALLYALKTETGLVIPFAAMNGTVLAAPDSIGMDVMDGDRFKTFFDKCMIVLAEQGIDPVALLEEVDRTSQRPQSLANWRPKNDEQRYGTGG